MKTRSDETSEPAQPSRRSFGKSLITAAMAVPLAASIAEAQKRRGQTGNKAALARRPDPRTGIPPIIIKAKESGGLEFRTDGTLVRDGGTVARPFRYVYQNADTYDISRLEFHGGLATKPDHYRNTAPTGNQIQFITNLPPIVTKAPTVIITQCTSPGCIRYVIESQLELTRLTGEVFAWRWVFPPLVEENPSDKVLRIKVFNAARDLLYDISDPLFDYDVDMSDGDQSRIQFS